MRELKTSDIFKVSKIFKKMNLKVDAKNKTQEEIGADLIVKVVENLYMAEDEVNAFLADMTGRTDEDIANLPLDELFKIVQQFRELKGIGNFLKLAGLSANVK